MEAVVYNQKGKEAGKVTLPESVFGVRWNPDLVHQVVTSMRSSARAGTAHTKNRGEVRGGGKKPWRQKGTGRARHGSIRSPLWVGGGVSHGPRTEKNYARKVNKKMRRAALASVLSQKLRDDEVLLLDKLVLPEIKTADAKNILSALSGIAGFEKISRKPRNVALIAVPQKAETLEKSFRNLGNVEVGEARNLNVLQALRHKFLVLVSPEESIQVLCGKEKPLADNILVDSK